MFGQIVRILSNGKAFQYPDEIDPSLWKMAVQGDAPKRPLNNGPISDEEKNEHDRNISPQEQRLDERNDDQKVLLVGWYGLDDPENPQNWSNSAKHLIAFQMCVLNFAVYIASSIYPPGEQGLVDEFGVSDTVAILGLSLFTFGYGVGPMLWSPLSEMPKLGRRGIFFWTLLAFIIFQLPVGLAPNVALFLVFRWVTGFCGSPCLATGGGTITDICEPTKVPYLLCIWSSAGVCGPVFGPIIGGFLAPAKGWRWTIWCFTWLCFAVLIMMFFLLPETSSANILYSRAKRLRKATQNDRLKSQADIDTENYTAKDHLIVLSRAFTLTLFEPIVLLMNLYAGLLYGVLFTWFESFPIVFGDIYGFDSGQQGLVFIGILVFAAISVACLLTWIRLQLVPKLKQPDSFKPEMVLPPTFIGCFALPICLFLFGWTSRASVPWIVSVICSGFFSIGVISLFNSLFHYLGITYARYAASIFAGSALFRASFGASFPLFATPLFDNFGIGPGNSLLGGIAVLFIPVPFIFYHCGERIRRWSKHAST
ncbi:MFS general substrate transporter [Penicillium malachiteum]|uniref:MFS general substrate transporter n=1 Tax=Penicillium malachiteum TaxID=1324776 RepID=UPI0025468061|nr:MFS general substrate transporter [Penicillium malachiteum]KAJ5715691.1 MFS general substrate transporter [Penicillium malachiteum]